MLLPDQSPVRGIGLTSGRATCIRYLSHAIPYLQSQLVLTDATFDYMTEPGPRVVQLSQHLLAWGGSADTSADSLDAMLTNYGASPRTITPLGEGRTLRRA